MATGMGEYPRSVPGESLSPELRALITALATRLLDGPSAAHAILREQLAYCRVARVEFTGAGLYAYFECPEALPRAAVDDTLGGDVPMEVAELEAGAGCLLGVARGRLDFLEVYTFGNESWPEAPTVLALGEASPIPLRQRAI